MKYMQSVDIFTNIRKRWSVKSRSMEYISVFILALFIKGRLTFVVK